jgi:hypothetical protein
MKRWVAYVCVPCLELRSELVEVGALARNQCNIISSLGKEASDDVQCKREQSCIITEDDARRGTSCTGGVPNTRDNKDGTSGHNSC